MGQPTDGERLELTPFIGALCQPGVDLGLAIIGKDSDDREKRVGKGGIVPFVLVGKGDDEVAIMGLFVFVAV